MARAVGEPVTPMNPLLCRFVFPSADLQLPFFTELWLFWYSFAYVEFSEKDAFDQALRLDGRELEGKRMHVNPSGQPSAGGTGGGGGGGRSNSANTMFVKGFDRILAEKTVSIPSITFCLCRSESIAQLPSLAWISISVDLSFEVGLGLTAEIMAFVQIVEGLHAIFDSCGKIVNIRVPAAKETGLSKGYLPTYLPTSTQSSHSV